MFSFEVGTVHSMFLVDEEQNVYECLIEDPKREIVKYYIKGNTMDVGQQVRMKYDEKEEKYKILGIL